MSIHITYTSRWMLHSGGTKFYRPVLVKVEGRGIQAAFVVGNYGSLKPRGGSRPGPESRPVAFGQCKVYLGDEAQYLDLIEKKSKPHGEDGGRYTTVGAQMVDVREIQDRVIATASTGRAIHEALASHFGARVADQIVPILFSESPDSPPSPGGDTKAVETTPRPEQWGSW